MDDAEVAEFEADMVDRPELAADVDVRQRIKAGLGLLEERNELAALIGKPSPSQLPRWLALAASVALVAISLWWFQRGEPASPLLASREGTAAVSIPSIILAATRGESAPPKIGVRPDSELIELRALVDAENSAVVEARLQRLQDAGAQDLGRVSAHVDSEGFLTVWLRVRGLEHGHYQLLIGTDGKPDAAQAFRFDVSSAQGQ
jgi:hypothetical protein